MKKLMEGYQNFLLHLKERIVYMMIFIVLFNMLGYYFPLFYYRNLDRTEYVTVEVPATIDKQSYRPCEKVIVTVDRRSKINTRGSNVVQLIQLVNEETQKRTTLAKDDFIIEVGRVILHLPYIIPCDTLPGKYFIETVIEYKAHDIERHYIWSTEGFSVTSL